MKYDIKTIEGALHIITITVNEGVDFTNYSVYGSCGGGCCCKHFIIEDQTNTQCKVVIPALSRGVYDYQLFAKQNDTNKEFLIISGQIIAEDRICDNANNSIDYKTTIADVTISADTVEVSVTIEGIQGEDGEKGDDGGYYIPSVSADGDLSWTATESDMPPVATVNIRGPQGEQGIQGEVGPQGPQGPQGEQGPAGEIDTSILEDYATIAYVDEAIAAGGGGGGSIDWAVVKSSTSDDLPSVTVDNGYAIGYGVDVTGDGGVGLGQYLNVGQCSVSIGLASHTNGGNNSIAIGNASNAQGNNRITIGTSFNTNNADNSTLLSSGSTTNNYEGVNAFFTRSYKSLGKLGVYFVTGGSQLSSDKLGGSAGFYIEDTQGVPSPFTTEYAIPFNKLVEVINGGGGGDTPDTPETDTTSSSFWADYYIGLSMGYTTKYKDCNSTSDMDNINSEWRQDLTENGEWNYALDNLNESHPAFGYWFSNYISSYGDLRSFNSYMPNVVSLINSFQYCQELESWICPTPQCTDMSYAFEGCLKLKHFRGDLRNLQNANGMFGTNSSNCTQLDLASVQHIAKVIPWSTWNTISLGVSNTLNGSSELETALQQIRDKSWTVEVYYSEIG